MKLQHRIALLARDWDGGQAALAKALGVSKNTFSRWATGKTTPSDAHLEQLAELTGRSVAWLRREETLLERLAREEREELANQQVRRIEFESDFSAGLDFVRRALEAAPGSGAVPTHVVRLVAPGEPVPLRGTASGSVTGSIAVSAAPLEWLQRPSGLEGKAGAYALTVRGRSMEPRLFEGDLIFVDPGQAPRPGDLCVVQMQDHSTADYLAYVKTFVRQSGKAVHLHQLNPDAALEYRFPQVRAVHRVIPARELFGL